MLELYYLGLQRHADFGDLFHVLLLLLLESFTRLLARHRPAAFARAPEGTGRVVSIELLHGHLLDCGLKVLDLLRLLFVL